MNDNVFNLSVTKKSRVMVEYLTDTGSGFAVTPEGDQVFLNQRLVQRMDVQEGEVYEAFLVPNYPDKRELIPWRGVRVEPLKEEEVEEEAPEKNFPSDLDINKNMIVGYMSEYDGAWTKEQLCEALDLSPTDVKEAIKACISDNQIQATVAYVLKDDHN